MNLMNNSGEYQPILDKILLKKLEASDYWKPVKYKKYYYFKTFQYNVVRYLIK